MDKVFVDTDIVLDLLSNREPFYSHSAQLFSEKFKSLQDCRHNSYDGRAVFER